MAGLFGWTISSTIQHIRIAKIRAKEIEIELRTKELEKKNGAELSLILAQQAQLNELKAEIAKLKGGQHE